ncbi:MAG: cyclic nucleotide-binding and patatin-like phospholipase domain-containing protein [Acidobacteriota bacterium]
MTPRRPSDHLAATPVFAGVSAGALAALDAAADWVLLAGGMTLFEQGNEPDALYLLVRGTLHVIVEDADGESHSVEYLEPGAVVGELGVLLAEPRSATLRALRDAELVRVPRATFMALLDTEPALGASLARLLGQRLKLTTTRPRVSPRVRTVALLPVGDRRVPGAFVTSLLDALTRSGATPSHLSSARVDRELGAGTSAIGRGESGDSGILELCDALERDHSMVVYESEAFGCAWTGRCLRQADLVVIVADAESSPEMGGFEQEATDSRPPASLHLVLLHGGDAPPSATVEWLRHRRVAAHHHVYPGRDEGFDRLARFLTGTAGGLVLSGGGARAFAHIGVIKALREARVPIDAIGGSSMGAIIAAQHAVGMDPAAMIEVNRRSFGGSDVGDLTVPTIALRRGRSAARRLATLFGDSQIEDLPIRYFCVTSDLTNARVQVHDRGPLWLWTRASCAIPGLVPPVPSEGRLLVDGGLLDNLPADVMRQRCSGVVIAVNVTPTVDLAVDMPLTTEMSGWPHLWPMLFGGSARQAFPNIAEILSRTVFVGSVRDAQEQARHSDLYIEPLLPGIGMGDFTAIDQIVEAGYRAAVAALAATDDHPGLRSDFRKGP